MLLDKLIATFKSWNFPQKGKHVFFQNLRRIILWFLLWERLFNITTFHMYEIFQCSHILPRNLLTFSQSASLTSTLSWRRSLSYRNQSIGLLCKSMDWFMYDLDLRHERVKPCTIKTVTDKTIIHTFFDNFISFSVLLYPSGIYHYDVNNENSRAMCEILSNLIIKTLDRCQCRVSRVALLLSCWLSRNAGWNMRKYLLQVWRKDVWIKKIIAAAHEAALVVCSITDKYMVKGNKKQPTIVLGNSKMLHNKQKLHFLKPAKLYEKPFSRAFMVGYFSTKTCPEGTKALADQRIGRYQTCQVSRISLYSHGLMDFFPNVTQLHYFSLISYSYSRSFIWSNTWSQCHLLLFIT